MGAADTDNGITENKAIEQASERLKARYASTEPAAVDAAVKAEERFRGARIRDFVPIFVERQARATLDASGEDSEPLRPA